MSSWAEHRAKNEEREREKDPPERRKKSQRQRDRPEIASNIYDDTRQ
jgi:hypothetical protein